MSWTRRTSKTPFDANQFMDALLPAWFAEAVDANLPTSLMHQKLRAWMHEAEIETAAAESRPADLTPPSESYVAGMHKLYTDMLKTIRGAA